MIYLPKLLVVCYYSMKMIIIIIINLQVQI